MPAASAVTLGRASYTIATTPNGTETFRISKPFSSVRCSKILPAGSSSEARLSRADAIPSIRPSSKNKRSISESFVPAFRASAQSTAFSAQISAASLRRAAAIANNALFFSSVEAFAIAALATLALCAATCASLIRTPPIHRDGLRAYRPNLRAIRYHEFPSGNGLGQDLLQKRVRLPYREQTGVPLDP